MRKLLAGLLAATLSALAIGATTTPVQLLSPAGSTAGQVILSNGPGSAPAWGNPSFSASSGAASVKDYGAKCDGVTDDSTAIQAALNAGKPAVFVPAGSCVASGLVMPTTYGFVLYGTGPSSVLIQKGGGVPVLSWPTGSITYNQGYVRDLAFFGTNGSNNTINTAGAGGLTLLNLYFKDIPTGYSSIFVNGAAATFVHDTRLDNIQIYSGLAGHSGVRFGALSADAVAARLMMNGNFATQYGLYFDAGAVTTQIQGGHLYNMATNIVAMAGSNNDISFNGVVFDNATQDLVSITGANNLMFTDSYFEAVKTGKRALVLSGTSGVTLYNTRFDGAVGATAAVVETGGSDHTKVVGGSFSAVGNFTTPFTFTGSNSYAWGLKGFNPLGTGFTSPVSITYSTPQFFINASPAGTAGSIFLQDGGASQWELQKSTANNLVLKRYVAGAFTDNPIVVSNSTGSVTFVGAVVPSQTVGITGTTTNNNANAGAWGEYNEATGTGVAMTTGTSTNIASVSLGAGDWFVFGNIVCTAGAGDTITNLASGFSTTSATLPATLTNRSLSGTISVPAGTAGSSQPPGQRLSLSGSTTVYLIGNITHAGGTAACDGHLRYWRRR